MENLNISVLFIVIGIGLIVFGVYDYNDKKTYRSSVETGSILGRFVIGLAVFLAGIFYLINHLFE